MRLRKVTNIILLSALDVIAFSLALFLAYISREMALGALNVYDYKHFFPFNISNYWWMLLVFLVSINYERLTVRRLSLWDEVRELTKAITVAVFVILAILSLGKIVDFSRITIVLLWAYSLFVFPFVRSAGKKFLNRFGSWRENVIIIGAGKAGAETARGLLSESHLGYNVVGFLDDDPSKAGSELAIGGSNYKVLGRVSEFRHLIAEKNISTVIIAMPSVSREKLSRMVNDIQKNVRKTLLVPELSGIPMINTELQHLFMQQLFLLKINNNLNSIFNKAVKRCLDLGLALLMLPFMVLLIFVIAICIKIDSPGPVFYSHTRVGHRGRPILVYKFRSMYQDARERLNEILNSDEDARREWASSYKLKNDPRVTRVGLLLRKTSLDELPQIWSVLTGEMSLVGPRPVLQKEIEDFYGEFSGYYFSVKPGITGLWQVSGRSNTSYDYRVKLDTWYVLNWSAWLDFVLLLKTVKTVIKREGAY